MIYFTYNIIRWRLLLNRWVFNVFNVLCLFNNVTATTTRRQQPQTTTGFGGLESRDATASRESMHLEQLPRSDSELELLNPLIQHVENCLRRDDSPSHQKFNYFFKAHVSVSFEYLSTSHDFKFADRVRNCILGICLAMNSQWWLLDNCVRVLVILNYIAL